MVWTEAWVTSFRHTHGCFLFHQGQQQCEAIPCATNWQKCQSRLIRHFKTDYSSTLYTSGVLWAVQHVLSVFDTNFQLHFRPFEVFGVRVNSCCITTMFHHGDAYFASKINIQIVSVSRKFYQIKGTSILFSSFSGSRKFYNFTARHISL